MAHSINKAFTTNKSDELYSPKILVNCLKPFFREWLSHQDKHITVWEPFGTAQSEFNWFFLENFPEVSVITSHIWDGQDFFEYEPEQWDIAVSNPPFSRKLDVFKRLNSFGKPWAMVMNTMALNYEEIGRYFADNPVQLLIPDRRVSFNGKPSSFNSSFVCRSFLPRDLMFCHLENNNAKKHFVPSRMYSHDSQRKTLQEVQDEGNESNVHGAEKKV